MQIKKTFFVLPVDAAMFVNSATFRYAVRGKMYGRCKRLIISPLPKTFERLICLQALHFLLLFIILSVG